MRYQRTAAEGGSIHAVGTRSKTKAAPWLLATGVAVLALSSQAQAAVYGFSLTGDGYSLSGAFTTTTDVSPKDPDPNCGTAGANPCRSDPAGATRITGITGTFTDSADGIVKAAIGPLIAISPGNERDPVFDPLPPSSLSFVDYAPTAFFSYDNLFFAAGSPIDCGTFPFAGTFLDDFGTAFTVAGGYTVNLWGDGDLHGPGTTAYGVDVVRGGALLSSSFDGLSGAAAVPEPSTWALMLVAFGGLGWRLRRQRVAGAAA